MIIYRIARTEFCDVSGEGAKKYGGRWNLPGYAVLYGSGSISSGLLERLTIDPELFSAERYVLYSVMEIHCPDKFIAKPDIKALPGGWDAIPFSKVSQEFGIRLIQSGVVCFAVPSVVDKTSLNYVLNPLTRDFDRLIKKVYPLKIDPRIVGR
jgi:RES domain-containing protein